MYYLLTLLLLFKSLGLTPEYISEMLVRSPLLERFLNSSWYPGYASNQKHASQQVINASKCGSVALK